MSKGTHRRSKGRPPTKYSMTTDPREREYANETPEERRARRSEREALVLSALSDNPQSVIMVADALGVSYGLTEHALYRLARRGACVEKKMSFHHTGRNRLVVGYSRVPRRVIPNAKD
jgi:predicted ArsR family transcriptional regulator